MKPQKGNMYPGVKTFNPLAGKCLHDCHYCSTNALKRFPVIKEKYSGEWRIDRNTLYKDLGSGNTWFVCAQNDLFAEGVSCIHVMEILTVCRAYNNRYLFQTKNPSGYYLFLSNMPNKTILCTTIETNRIYPQMGNTPSPIDRAIAMSCIKNFPLQITIEPIMRFDLKELVELIRMTKAEVVNIGADSKNNHLPEPTKAEVLALIDELSKFTAIERKTNLKRLLQ
jgi:hypothetical protein